MFASMISMLLARNSRSALVTVALPNSHFAKLSVKFAFTSRSNTFLNRQTCYVQHNEYNTRSSRYALQFGTSCKTILTRRWRVAEAFLSPKAIAVY